MLNDKMKVWIVFDQEIQGVFRTESAAVAYMLDEILGNYITRSAFLKSLEIGGKTDYHFAPEDIARYQAMTTQEFDTFIRESVNGSVSRLEDTLRKFGDDRYEWSWGFEITEHTVE